MVCNEQTTITDGHAALNAGYDQDKPPMIIDLGDTPFESRGGLPSNFDLVGAVQAAMTGDNVDQHRAALDDLRQAQTRN